MESPDGPKYCLYCLDPSLESFCSRDWKRDGDCGRQRDTALIPMIVTGVYLFARGGEGETISSRLIKGSKSVTLFKRVTRNMPHTIFHGVYGKGN